MRLVQLRWCNFLIFFLKKYILEPGESGLIHFDFYQLKFILYLKKN